MCEAYINQSVEMLVCEALSVYLLVCEAYINQCVEMLVCELAIPFHKRQIYLLVFL